MKAVLRLPNGKTPEGVTQEGYLKAASYCRDSQSLDVSPEEWFASLRGIYSRCAHAYEHAAENFYEDEYIARGNDKNQTQAHAMMLLAFQSKGLLDGIYERMEDAARRAPALQQEMEFYRYAQREIGINLHKAFRVYSVGSAAFKPLLRAPDVAGFIESALQRWRGISPV